MSLTYKFTITTAVAFSAISVYDAVYHGLTGRGSVFSDEYGRTWATIAGCLLAALTFGALVVVLVTGRRRIDTGSRTRCLIRRLLAVDLAVLAVTFATGATTFANPTSPVTTALAPVAGVAFAGMFLLAFALGLSTVKVRELRVSTILLIAVLPIAGLTVALQALGTDFAHPAYAETAVYLGIALLGRRPVADPKPEPANRLARATS
jgi:hypothetical protein